MSQASGRLDLGLRPGSLVRRAGTRRSFKWSTTRPTFGMMLGKLFFGRRRQVTPFGEAWGMSALPSETVFDSPLQEAIHLLTALGAHMEARRLQGEADTLRRALHLLHSPELNNSKSLKQLISAGEMQVDQQLVDWLVQMEWLPKSQEDGEAGSSSAAIESAPASAALRVPTSKPGASGAAPPLLPPPPEDETMRASAFVSRESSDGLLGAGGGAVSPRSQPLFAPCVVRSLLPENEREVLLMLEEGIDEWEFDALRLHELTDGHSLAALGWALFHRHRIHVALGVSDATLTLFFLP